MYRDIGRKLNQMNPASAEKLRALLPLIGRLLTQRRCDTQKLYGLHAPEVECIAKGKAHEKYEFGVKVSVATTTRGNFVVGVRALPGNPSDGHVLGDSLDQVQRPIGAQPSQVFLTVASRGTARVMLRSLLLDRRKS
jgi:IS5 family transposase